MKIWRWRWVSSVRWETVPALVASVTRCMRSSSFRSLSEKAFGELCRALRQIDDVIARDDVTARVARVLPADEAEAVIAALADALAVRPQARGTIDALVARSLELDQPDLEHSICERVNALLGAPGAAILAIKRESTVTDRQLLMTKARIETDIRPVFADTGESPDASDHVAAAIVHTLRLEVFTDWQPTTLHIALPDDGLSLLKSIIERAERKQEILSDAIGKGGLRLFPEDTR